jgi:hypothetical protein
LLVPFFLRTEPLYKDARRMEVRTDRNKEGLDCQLCSRPLTSAKTNMGADNWTSYRCRRESFVGIESRVQNCNLSIYLQLQPSLYLGSGCTSYRLLVGVAVLRLSPRHAGDAVQLPCHILDERESRKARCFFLGGGCRPGSSKDGLEPRLSPGGLSGWHSCDGLIVRSLSHLRVYLGELQEAVAQGVRQQCIATNKLMAAGEKGVPGGLRLIKE